MTWRAISARPYTAAAAAARSRGIASVVTSVFDSGVGVAACAHLAAALDSAAAAAAAAAAAEAAAAEVKALTDARDGVDHRWSSYDGGDRDDGLHAGSWLGVMAHGLGTGAWLAGDVMEPPAATLSQLSDGGVGIVLGDTAVGSRLTTAVSVSTAGAWGVEAFYEVTTGEGSYQFRVVDSAPARVSRSRSSNGGGTGGGGGVPPPVILLHGYLGRLVQVDRRLSPFDPGLTPA
jgi:isochorismate synthase/2-succinyl-5-enolpyruvyl-6-hydroxy-3-cyclohexene-1-carboxylate synthase/2-succinyl-6-hydroxy-2,4-cyclohexadiene-1-carboxylate synthase/O-succinylbenzoate synthase